MASYPKPDDWQGGSDNGKFIRQMSGHVSMNPNTIETQDIEHRRNGWPIGESCITDDEC